MQIPPIASCSSVLSLLWLQIPCVPSCWDGGGRVVLLPSAGGCGLPVLSAVGAGTRSVPALGGQSCPKQGSWLGCGSERGCFGETG